MESQLKHTVDAIAQKRRSMAAIQLELDKQASAASRSAGRGLMGGAAMGNLVTSAAWPWHALTKCC